MANILKQCRKKCQMHFKFYFVKQNTIIFVEVLDFAHLKPFTISYILLYFALRIVNLLS